MTSENISLAVATLDDINDWDAYANAHNDATAYHSYAWLQAVNKAYHHEPIGIIARDINTKMVVGILPAVLMKTPLIGKQVCALPYCDVGFAIADTPEIITNIHQYLEHQSSLAGSKRLEIRNVDKTISDSESLKDKKVRMLLTLPGDGETLMAGFKSKLRSQIRKATKNGLTVELGRSTTLVEDFYEVYTRNMRDLCSPVHSKTWFEQIVEAYSDTCIISVVYKENVAVGAGLVLKNNHRASIPWASTLRDYNKLAPNMLLYWSLLEHCANNNITNFDFGRSTFEEGTYKFKKQWGAQPQLLKWMKLDKNNTVIDNIDHHPSTSKMKAHLEDVWRKLPLRLTIAIGSNIRPYISL